MSTTTLDTGKWVKFRDLDNMVEVLKVYNIYFLGAIRMNEDFLFNRGNSEGVLELKHGEGLNGFTYVIGENHDSRLNALRRLNYPKVEGFDLDFKFDDYNNKISGFVWRRVE